MELADKIILTENRFRLPLEKFFKKNWTVASLVSHGLDHHRRVWSYAKEILSSMFLSGIRTGMEMTDKLILACYMHDIGMSVEHGERHGKISIEFCNQFITETNLDEPWLSEVIYAIENHDNKEYIANPQERSLLSILSVADDLDAFGFIGIYRYMEVFIARGMNPYDAAYHIRSNAARRFENFLRFSSSIRGLEEKHKPRYLILDRFFDDFIRENQSQYDEARLKGIMALMDQIPVMILKNEDTMNDLPGFIGSSYDRIMSEFLDGLQKELKVFGWK